MKRTGLAIFLFLAAMLVAAPQGAHAFGALAIDSNHGDSYGFSFQQPNAEAARKAAVAKCGTNCKAVVYFRNTCAAYAADQAEGSTVYGWGYAPNKERAQSIAMDYCKKNGSACLIRVWACEGPARNDGKATADDAVIASLPSSATRNTPAPQASLPLSPPPKVAPPPVQPAPLPAVSPAVTPPLPQFSSDGTRRIALVIGNDRYDQLPSLQKAGNDARAVGDTLQRLGFEVIRIENAPRRVMNQKLVEFTGKIGRGDTAFFFYAGHGVEVKGINYLLPSDTPQARDGEEGLVTGEGIAADSIIERMQERGAKVSLVVLDACRDNPFKRPGTRGVGTTRGLGQMTAPEGVFVLYSAGLGQTALDRLSDKDPHPNSVFTRTFVSLLGKPGISLQQVAKDTQLEVRRLAATINHPQMPAYYDQILGSFTLAPVR
jgi:hypothetical protein